MSLVSFRGAGRRAVGRSLVLSSCLVLLGSFPARTQTEDLEEVLTDPPEGVERGLEKRDDTPLIVAARRGDLAGVRKLLEDGATVDAPGRFGRTALMAALQVPSDGGGTSRRLDLVRFLIDAKADLSVRDAVGNGVLFFLPEPEDLAVVDLLLERGIPIDEPNRGGATPLFTAAFRGHRQTVVRLLDRGARADRASRSGRTPFSEAVLNGHFALANLLLERKARKNPVFSRGLTLLHTACEQGKPSSVHYLLGKGVDVDLPLPDTSTRRGDTPLVCAVRKGRIEVTGLLLDQGADPDRLGGRSMTPLQEAVAAGHLRVTRLLVAAKADVNAPGREKNRSVPLVLAAMGGHGEIARRLVEAGADVNGATRRKVTALMFASYHGHVEIVALLLSKGADVACRSRDGNTALTYAVVRRHRAVLSRLLEKEAEPDEEFELLRWGFVTPILLAAARGDLEMTRALLAAGAECEEARDVEGMGHVTPLMVAAARGTVETVRALVEAGASIETRDDRGRRPLEWAILGEKSEIEEYLRSLE